MLRALAQQHRALGGRLAEVEAGVEDDLLGSQADRLGPLGPVAQERGDVGDEIVVVRIGIGDAGPQPDVGGDDGGVVLGRDPEVVGIVEAGDVVADDRARAARGVEHRRPPGVDRERHVEAGLQRLDRGHDPVELLGLVDLGPGAGLHPADVEQVGAVGDELLGPAHERVEVPGRAPVVERIGGAVQDPHDDDRAGARRATRSPSRRVGNGSTGTEAGYRCARGEPGPRRDRARPRRVDRERDAAPARATA